MDTKSKTPGNHFPDASIYHSSVTACEGKGIKIIDNPQFETEETKVMKELSNIQQTMSSREIAELTGKPHNDTLKAIRSMEPAWEKINGRNFSLVDYVDAKGERRPQYELSKTECLYVATKFNDEARAKLVLRWEELETSKPSISTLSRKDLAQMIIESEEEREQLQLTVEAQSKALETQAPAVTFAHAVVGSKNSCLIGELAKILQQNGVDMGQNRLFEWMRNNGYLCSKGEYYNQPTQKSMEMGLFEIKKTSISKPDGVVLLSCTTKVTGKGQVYFVNKFLNTKDQ